jgi:hypothetical protein
MEIIASHPQKKTPNRGRLKFVAQNPVLGESVYNNLYNSFINHSKRLLKCQCFFYYL